MVLVSSLSPGGAGGRGVGAHAAGAADGPVPDGHRLKCLDGDKTNCDPSNWEAVPMALAPRLNGRFGRGYDTAPAELVEGEMWDVDAAETDEDVTAHEPVAEQEEPLPAWSPAPFAAPTEQAERIEAIGEEELEQQNAIDIKDVFQGEAGVKVGGGSDLARKSYINGIEDSNLNVKIDGARQVGTTFLVQWRNRNAKIGAIYDWV